MNSISDCAEVSTFGDTCPAAHLLVGPDGRVRDVNSALTRILGYSRQEIIGRHVMEFVQPQDTGRVLEQLGPDSASANDPAMEVSVLAKDGTARTLLLARNSTLRGQGSSRSVAEPGVLLTGIDISDSKAAREITRQSELCALRDRHMDAIAAFARGVATQFESLMSVVTECAEKLREARPTDAEAAEAIERALGNTSRSARIAEALTSLASGPKLLLSRVEPGELIDSAADALRPLFEDQVEVATTLQSPLPEVWADPRAMREALIELGLNARDALGKGGTCTLSAEPSDIDETISLRCGRDLPAGRYVSIAVTDTGEGMDERVLTQAFEPFFTTRDPRRWAGLGLAKVYNCVAAHRGSVSISSSPGQGARVTILLPAALPEIH